MTEDETAGWYHQLDAHESEWTLGDGDGRTGRPGVLSFMGSQRVGHDWATDLIWSDLAIILTYILFPWLDHKPSGDTYFILDFAASSVPFGLVLCVIVICFWLYWIKSTYIHLYIYKLYLFIYTYITYIFIIMFYVPSILWGFVQKGIRKIIISFKKWQCYSKLKLTFN